MISVSKKLSAAALTRTTASPGAGHRVGDIGKFKVVGGAVAGAEQGFHGGSVGYWLWQGYLAWSPAGLAASDLVPIVSQRATDCRLHLADIRP